MTGIERIAAERKRQIEVEGYTPEHDAEHDPLELMMAAWVYLQAAAHPSQQANAALWPWEPESFKPSPDPARNLEKAGALIAAALDLLPEPPE